MILPSDMPAPPEPATGLTDPRTTHHGPEILGAGGDVPPETGQGEALAGGPPGREEGDVTGTGSPGLVDPRGEIPEPSAP